jgi:glycerophosphoryl diester phosphodiesterase
LVCVHDGTIDRTSSGTGKVSDMTLAELREHDFGSWHQPKPQEAGGPRTAFSAPAKVLTLAELITLVLDWGGPVKLFVETKHPVRYGGLVEAKLLAELQRFGLATPASAAHAKVVVMSFAASAVWRVRRSAPLLPTVLLGDASYYLGGGAATTVGATAVGPSIKSLRERPALVDRAEAAGRSTYCWTVDEQEDVRFCSELGVRWIATNYPDRTKRWLQGE